MKRPAGLDLLALDTLRGLAALYVVVHHARQFLWRLDGADQGVPSGVPELLAAFVSQWFRYGDAAVFFFFLISGFCIHYRQAQIMAAEPRGTRSFAAILGMRSYVWRRVRRIYPPLVFALAVTAGLDWVGSRIAPAFYAGVSPYVETRTPFVDGAHYAVKTFAVNLLAQGGLVVPTFGSDVPLWSLSIEVWFYVLYPILLWFSWRRGASLMLTMALLVSTAGAVAQWSLHLDGEYWVAAGIRNAALRVLVLWAIWAVGAFLAEAQVGRARIPWPAWWAPIGLLGIMVIAPRSDELVPGLPPTVRAYIWSAFLALLLGGVVLGVSGPLARLLENGARRIRFLGQMSYSLYLLHFPWMTLLSAWWLKGHARLPSGAELLVPGLLSSLLLGALGWYCVERHLVSARPVQRHGADAVRLQARGAGNPVPQSA